MSATSSQEIIEHAKIIARKVEAIMKVLGDERGGDGGGTLASLSYDVLEEAQLETLTKQIVSAATSIMKATSELRLRAALLDDSQLIEQLRRERSEAEEAGPLLAQLEEDLKAALTAQFEIAHASEILDAAGRESGEPVKSNGTTPQHLDAKKLLGEGRQRQGDGEGEEWEMA